MNQVEVGVNCKSLFVDGTLHIIGGSKNRRHLFRHIYDRNEAEHKQPQFRSTVSAQSPKMMQTPSLKVVHSTDSNVSVDSMASIDEDDSKQSTFSSMFKFKDWAKGIQNCGLVHVRSKGQFILFGGYDQYSDHKYCDMVYVLDQRAADGKRPRWIKKCKMPERACYFGDDPFARSLSLSHCHSLCSVICTLCNLSVVGWSGYVLSSDERYIVVLGGYSKNKSLVKRIYVLDVDAMKFVKSTSISSPASGSVRATMGDDDLIYVLKHDDGAMWRVSIRSVVEEYSSSNEDNYAYRLVKKYKKLLQVAEAEKRQNRIQIKKLQNQLTAKKVIFIIDYFPFGDFWDTPLALTESGCSTLS